MAYPFTIVGNVACNTYAVGIFFRKFTEGSTEYRTCFLKALLVTALPELIGSAGITKLFAVMMNVCNKCNSVVSHRFIPFPNMNKL